MRLIFFEPYLVNMKFIGIIPARFASTRFPGKPLADILGKPMIQRVCEQAAKAFESVWVATDDNRIYDAVKEFGANAVMTATSHASGTDRLAEAIEKIIDAENTSFDVIVNIQGDEPFIQPEQLEQLKSCFTNTDTQIATLVKLISNPDDITNPNIPKVVISTHNEALFFSRSPIPYIRGVDQNLWAKKHNFYKHVGIYAYKYEILKQITALKQSPLEKAESLEQLRWLENNYRIRVAITNFETIAIDTPQDLEKINTKL